MSAIRKEFEATDEAYRDFLDEVYEDVEICGQTFRPGRALQELDPIAFSCGKSEYESQQDEDNPVWMCSDCGKEFDDEDEANECCEKENLEDEEEGFQP